MVANLNAGWLGLALLVVMGAFLAGYTASALSPNLLVTPSTSIGPVLPPGSTSTSHGYGLGYVVEVYKNNILEMSSDYVNNTVGVFALANTGSISVAYSLGYGLGAEGYSQAGTGNASATVIVDPTPDTISTTTTISETQTVTTTTTYITTTTITQGRTYTITTPIPLAPTSASVNTSSSFPVFAALAFLGVILLGLGVMLSAKK